MEIGAGRSGRGHGPWQPKVKGELRRLGKGTQQNEQQRGGIERMVGELAGRLGQDGAERVGAGHLRQQHHAAQHSQRTQASDDQGATCAFEGLAILQLKGNQQIAG